MEVGYIKLHRKIKSWEWYDDANAFRLFIHCLIQANHKDKIWKGIEIKRGQFHTSTAHLCTDLKLSEKEIRGALKKLIKTNEVASRGANNGTMITICNYDSYQGDEEIEGQAEWQAEGRTKGERKGEQRATTNNDKNELKNDKENKKKENIPTPVFNFAKSFIELGADENIVSDYIKVRKAKKATNTKTAFDSIIREIKKTNLTINECLKLAVEKSWSGFNADWDVVKTHKPSKIKKSDEFDFKDYNIPNDCTFGASNNEELKMWCENLMHGITKKHNAL